MKICDHTSVGMLVWNDDKLLLIERMKFPFGFSCPAGHVDGDNSYEESAKRELKEEVGLDAAGLELEIEGRRDNKCRREDGGWHHWKVYSVDANGEVDSSKDETKGFVWADKDKINELGLKTEKYRNGEISEDDWQSSPGIEPVWYDLLLILA